MPIRINVVAAGSTGSQHDNAVAASAHSMAILSQHRLKARRFHHSAGSQHRLARRHHRSAAASISSQHGDAVAAPPGSTTAPSKRRLPAPAHSTTASSPTSHRAFSRHLHELHGAPPCHRLPPQLGRRGHPPLHPYHRLILLPRRSPPSLLAGHGLRHSRALFISDPEDDGAQELLLWEPITGFRQRVPVPEAYETTIFQPSAAVLCAADGCGHHDCLGGPFCLVFVFSVEDLDTDEEELAMLWLHSLVARADVHPVVCSDLDFTFCI
ncbi:hypothetical protein ZWY2020_018940 [Hordeum vulgare]|nr:hypothetical protein ZWY2020_018940 [Hordeum vulgare]